MPLSACSWLNSSPLLLWLCGGGGGGGRDVQVSSYGVYADGGHGGGATLLYTTAGILNGATYEGNLLRFDVSVIAMDIVDISNDKTTDIFIGNDNLQDVLNTQLAVLVRLLEVLRRGENANTFRLDGTPSFEHFTDRFEHGVAGWTVTLDIVVPHGMTIC